MNKVLKRKKGNKDQLKLDPVASELISFVSHQIKSPLNAIKGYSDLIITGHYGDVPQEALIIIKRIKASADRAIDLAKNILDFKKIEEGKMQYDFQSVDVNNIIAGVIEELVLLAETKKLKLSFSSSKEPRMALVDKQQMHQVILNLIDNAIKYTLSGWIKVECAAKGKKVIIKVSDSGRGMDAKAIKTIFDKFTREIKSGQTISGSGLGLFIAKNIVEDHKGKIWAESEGEGRGSTFFVELPI